MEFIDARRLTGPSLLFDRPGSILDVACTEEEAARLEPAWEKHLRRMLDAVGWQDCELSSIRLTGGVSLGYTAPIDALYAASEINEWAWAASAAELHGAVEPDFDEALERLLAAETKTPDSELLAGVRARLFGDDG